MRVRRSGRSVAVTGADLAPSAGKASPAHVGTGIGPVAIGAQARHQRAAHPALVVATEVTEAIDAAHTGHSALNAESPRLPCPRSS
jgi:hypothetical protein